jgi:hypothetical protein
LLNAVVDSLCKQALLFVERLVKIPFRSLFAGRLEAAQELIDYGADTDLRDNFGHK